MLVLASALSACKSGGSNTGGAGSGGSGATGLAGSTGSGGAVAQTCLPPPNQTPIAKLSQTGCMDPADPKKLAPSVMPYEVNSPLWSDGADKARGLALPAGGKIHVKDCAAKPSDCVGTRGLNDDGRWVMPVGTVMVKSFLFDNKMLETRLLVHFDAATWVGYSYKWDEAQTDATLVGEERDEVMFATGQRTVHWHFPSRMDCMKCHVEGAAFALGTETAQFNRTVGGTNQIDKLTAMGAFEVPPAKPYKPALVIPVASQAGTPSSGNTVEARALSYLHANCAFCHRPDDGIECSAGEPCLDLRLGTSFKDMNVCNIVPAKGDMGIVDGVTLAPGQPSKSILWARMNAQPDDADGKHGRMPQIASYVVDQMAVDLIGSWITSISACP